MNDCRLPKGPSPMGYTIETLASRWNRNSNEGRGRSCKNSGCENADVLYGKGSSEQAAFCVLSLRDRSGNSRGTDAEVNDKHVVNRQAVNAVIGRRIGSRERGWRLVHTSKMNSLQNHDSSTRYLYSTPFNVNLCLLNEMIACQETSLFGMLRNGTEWHLHPRCFLSRNLPAAQPDSWSTYS